MAQIQSIVRITYPWETIDETIIIISDHHFLKN